MGLAAISEKSNNLARPIHVESVFGGKCTGQGDYEPGCQYCRHIDASGEIRRCGLHNIPVPELREDGDFLCSDWQLMQTSDSRLWSWIKSLPTLYKDYLNALKPGTLYYSAGYSQEGGPRPFWGKLDYIKSVKNFMFRAELWRHERHGWVIYPDSSHENSPHLPRTGHDCTISLDGERLRFRARRIVWKRPKIGILSDHGELIPVKWRRGVEKILTSPEAPDALSRWANRYFDVDKVIAENGKEWDLQGWGISVFLEVIEPRGQFQLRPALHFHPMYVRDKALLDDE